MTEKDRLQEAVNEVVGRYRKILSETFVGESLTQEMLDQIRNHTLNMIKHYEMACNFPFLQHFEIRAVKHSQISHGVDVQLIPISLEARELAAEVLEGTRSLGIETKVL